MDLRKFMTKVLLAGSQVRQVFCVVALVTLFSAGTGNCWWGSSFSYYYWQPPSPIYLVVAGMNHTVGIRQDGTVTAWGDNTHSQLAVPSGLGGVVAVAAGAYHSVALKSDGSVVAWGDNTYGQLNMPWGLTGVKAIAAGLTHTLALKNDGTVVAWGNNNFGQCVVPVNLTGVIAITAGANHSVALVSGGYTYQWGTVTPPQPITNGTGTISIPSLGGLVS